MPVLSLPATTHKRHAALAARIIDAALAEAWHAGQRLTEQELAEKLDVSRTPVRAALRVLAGLGVVAPTASRGYALALGGRALAALALTTPPDAEESLRATLINDRLGGALAASQTQVALARRYNVGAPVLRRVLRRMEEEGLVSHDGWRWTFVPTLETEQSCRASYELRLLIEPAALLLPDFTVRPDELAALAERHDALLRNSRAVRRDPAAAFALDARLHETLASFSNNPFILNIIRQQNALRRLLEMATYDDVARVVAWCREHQAILAALLRGDRQAASTLLAQHLSSAAAAASRLRP